MAHAKSLYCKNKYKTFAARINNNLFLHSIPYTLIAALQDYVNGVGIKQNLNETAIFRYEYQK